MKVPEHLTIIQSISQGNFGNVLLCENKYLSRKEAVKIIEISQNQEEVLDELKSCLFESNVLEYLKGSPYIVNVYGADHFEGNFLIKMEYVEKGSVQDLLNQSPFLNIKTALKISECVLFGLEYAHTKSIFHLDVKPANILFKNENIYQLSDFGLSRIRDQDGTSTFDRIYTIHIPPERVSGQQNQATEQTDIYMFGLTLYRLLNGDLFTVQQWEDLKQKNLLVNSIINGKFPDRKKYRVHIPTKIKKIVNKCLNVDLSKRYKTIRELRHDIGKLKREYDWILQSYTDDKYHWKCFQDDKIVFELVVQKNSTWEIILMKFSRNKKIRVGKHCHKKLDEKIMQKNVNKIFNEYF